MTMHKSMSAMEQYTLCCFRRSTIIPILRTEITGMCYSGNITNCLVNCSHAIVLVAAHVFSNLNFSVITKHLL